MVSLTHNDYFALLILFNFIFCRPSNIPRSLTFNRPEDRVSVYSLVRLFSWNDAHHTTSRVCDVTTTSLDQIQLQYYISDRSYLMGSVRLCVFITSWASDAYIQS